MLKSSRKKWISLLAGLIAAACTYWILLRLSGMELSGLWREWQGADPIFLTGILIFSLAVHIFLGSDKLWRVLKATGFSLPYSLVLKIRLGSGPLRLAIPVDAGEILNIAFFRQHQKIPLADASGACLFDRGLNFLGSTFWLVFGLLLLPMKGAPLFSQGLLIICVGGLYGVFLFAPPVQGLLVNFADRIHAKAGGFARGILTPFSACTIIQKFFFLAYGIVFQARPLIVCYLLFMALGVKPPLETFIAFASLAVFAGHIPTAAGVGPREAALMALFSGLAPVGALFAVGAAMSLFVHVIPMMAGLPWLPWFVRGILNTEATQNI